MSWNDPPQPPDPIRTAAAATATNVGTSVANAYLNNINQVTSEGSLQYSTGTPFTWNDPTTGATYSIPTFTASQILSPDQQAIRGQTIGAKTNMAELANTQSQYMQNLLGTPFSSTQGNFNPQAYLASAPDVAAYAQAHGLNPIDFAYQHYRDFGQGEGRTGGFANPAPGAGDINALHGIGYAYSDIGEYGQQQRALGPTGSQAYDFGGAGDVTRGYGPADNFSADRGRVEEALYGRLQPQLQVERANLEQRLADQGIRYGSEAYHQAMDDYNRQSTDARLAVTAAGGAEQQRMMDMAAKEAGFENAAQQQLYQQQLGRGQFYNQAQAQQFQQALQGGTFANQAQQQAFQQAALRTQAYNASQAQNLARNQSIFSAQNQLRQQAIAEQTQQRNQPINEISALLSGSQVSGPQFVNTPQQNIANTDVAGLINNRFNQDLQNFQQQNANFNSLMGGIFGMMGGMIMSDRREKENIDRVGTVFATNPDKAEADDAKKLPIYQYSYKDDPSSTRHIGPMAQDVERIDPKAVKSIKGVKHIDVTRMGSILRAA